jgi:hypothetical protein
MDNVQICSGVCFFVFEKFETSLFGSDLDLFISRQCCGSVMFILIPDPNYFHPGSASKNLSI